MTYKEWINSDECAECARQVDMWQEAEAFKVAALAGEFELAATIAHGVGVAPDIAGATAFIELCSKNDHRYGVCGDHSLEAWCEDTFTA